MIIKSNGIQIIGWLSVSSVARNRGVATSLINFVFHLVKAPGQVSVTTFGEDVPDGRPARNLYTKFGFIPLDVQVPNGPEGGSRQEFTMHLQRPFRGKAEAENL